MIKKGLRELKNKLIIKKVTYATAIDEEVKEFIEKEKELNNSKVELTKNEIKSELKEVVRYKLYIK